jgi:GNAT superfamily N-acetyltransferase
MNTTLTFRPATADDLITIVQMLADDTLGARREKMEIPLPEAYQTAFARISADVNQELTVACIDGVIVGTFQLTFIQYLTHQGGLRAQIEAVRVSSAHRGKGIGAAMFRYAIARAKETGCYVVQLTTDKKRPRAVQFYESLGFVATHEGMKRML